MKKSRFTEEQIIGILKEQQMGLSVRRRGGRKRALDTRASTVSLEQYRQSSHRPP